MEKRVIGIVLTILGIGGLIFAAFSFLSGRVTGNDIKQMIAYGVLGAIFFTAGISLIRNTRDNPS